MKMGKTESIWRFGEFTVVNSWNRTRYSTTEKSEIFRFGYSCRPVASGTYSWINRPWQRYDYESSFDNAVDNLLSIISWSQYEAWKSEIDLMKKALKDMEEYKGTPKC